MSVTLTDIGFKFMPILATNPMIPDNKYKPNKIMHEWIFAAQGVGDGSAGAIECAVDFGTFDKNHYIAITAFFTTHTTSSIAYFYTHTDRWDNLYFPGHTNEALYIWRAETSSTGFPWTSQLVKPLYLGRPRLKDSDSGLCHFIISPNTNSENYNITIQGYTLERPLPFTSILQP